VEFLIRFENVSSETLKDVTVGNNMPKYAVYVFGTTRLKNGLHSQGASGSRATTSSAAASGYRPLGGRYLRSAGRRSFRSSGNEIYKAAQVLIHT
jgi:hypothetical protein